VLEEMKRNKKFLTNRYLKEFKPSMYHERPIKIKQPLDMLKEYLVWSIKTHKILTSRERMWRYWTVWTDKQIQAFVEKLVIVWNVIVVVGVLTCLVHYSKNMLPTEVYLKYSSTFVYEYYPLLVLVCLNYAYHYGAAVLCFCNFVCKAIVHLKEADKLVEPTTLEYYNSF
jgi:hypothetical protein